MGEDSEVQARITQLETRLAFLEQAQRVGRVGSWRASPGPTQPLELTEEAYGVLGIAPGTLVRNVDFFQMVHPEDRQRFLDAVVSVRTNGGRMEIEVRRVDADGSERTLQITAASIPGESPETGTITGTLTEVTRRHLEELDLAIQQRIAAEEDLKRAIDEGELFLEYQPILSLDTAELRGAEALVRWQHPVRGRLEPIEFVGFAEESGLILLLGEWVIATACGELRRWLDEGVGDEFVMSINLSAVQLRTDELPDVVKKALHESGVPGASVLLEVTESVLLEGALDESSLSSIRDLGVHVSVDDFGTKYSSLDYLARLPVDGLKIDASFIQAIDEGAGRAVVDAIAALGRALGLRVTAEGIETDDQLVAVRDAGCHAAQGFLISRPLPADECLLLLKT